MIIEFILPIATSDPETQAVKAAEAWLNPVFHGGVVVEVSGFGPYGETTHAQVLLRGYLSHTPENIRLLDDIQKALPHQPYAHFYDKPRIKQLATADWAEAWKRHYHSLRIGERIVVAPSWEKPSLKENDILIQLDPGMAFGTGTHPSTQLALRLLQKYQQSRWQVLDVGTGSGILAIAAVKMGAAQVVATDIDAEAVRTAAQNAQLNGVADKISLQVGSAAVTGQFELVVANILADVIADLLLTQNLAARVADNGVLILSGIIKPRREVVDLALQAVGMEVIDSVEDGDWIAVAAKQATINSQQATGNRLRRPDICLHSNQQKEL